MDKHLISINLFGINHKLTIMKKSVIILSSVLLAFSSVAIVYLNQGNSTFQNQQERNTERKELPEMPANFKVINPDYLKRRLNVDHQEFHLAIESRFNATISKEKLETALSIHNLVPKGSTDGIRSFQNVKISKLVKEDMRIELGNNGKLNPNQMDLLRSLAYSDNFCVEATIQRENELTGEIKQDFFVYYITVVPETESSYEEGHDALLNHFRTKSEPLTAGIKVDELQAGKVRFTITKEGKIDAVEWESTSGNTEIDLRMLELLNELPGKWIPATNAKGEKVDQELILSFGSMGC